MHQARPSIKRAPVILGQRPAAGVARRRAHAGAERQPQRREGSAVRRRPSRHEHTRVRNTGAVINVVRATRRNSRRAGGGVGRQQQRSGEHEGGGDQVGDGTRRRQQDLQGGAAADRGPFCLTVTIIQLTPWICELNRREVAKHPGSFRIRAASSGRSRCGTPDDARLRSAPIRPNVAALTVARHRLP